MQGEWPLVGRSGELRVLAGQLRRADGGGCVLVGPPGVGKTRLAAEALALADAAGTPTARVSDPRELLGRAAAALAARADAGRLVLQIDDAHLLDDASATLVHRLTAARGAVVLVTLRAGEAVPEDVTALWKESLAERLDVAALGVAEIGELLAQVLAGPVDPSAVARLHAHSEGNLTYLRELLRSARESGALVDDAGMWRLVGPPAVTGRLAELLEARLAGLDPARRALLEGVAFGEPVGAAELAALGDPADAEELEARGLLHSAVDGRRLTLRPAHPLYGELLRAGATGPRRRDIVRTLADTVAATGARRAGDVVRVAGWRLESGGASAAELLRATEVARRAFDFARAERFARAAAAAGAGFDALVVAAELAGLQGRGAEAEAELAALAGSTDAERARLAVGRMDNLRFFGRIREALAVGAEAEATLPPGPLRAEIEARRAAMRLTVDGPAAAARAAAAVRAAWPDPAGAPGAAVAWACLTAALALTRTGDFDGAREAAAAGLVAHAGADPPPRWPPWVLELADADADARTATGDPAGALERAAPQHSAAVAAGALDAQSYAALTLARAALAQGRVRTAARRAREATTLLRSLGRAWVLPAALAVLARAEALARRTAAADAALAELADVAAGEVPAWVRAEALGAQAWAAVSHGDLPRARRLLAEAAAAGQGCGDLLGAGTALHDLARLGRPGETAGPLRELAGRMGGALAAVQAAHADALVRQDPDALAAAAAAFARLGAGLLAAEATADCAAARQQAGQRKAAAADLRAAEGLAALCEGASTPALAGLDARAVLTPAEREAAQLAAAGRANREIAAGLYLSVRTVENRLQRVYEKLGVSSRAELAAALEP